MLTVSRSFPLSSINTDAEKSQRVTDVVLKAFHACAASQGDCNNLTFGFGGNLSGEEETKGFGYYETIAGGSGAVSPVFIMSYHSVYLQV